MRMVHLWRSTALACAAVLACSTGLRAQDGSGAAAPSPEHKALHTSLYNTLRDVINHGADLYNEPNGDWNGCYRLYEGALMAVRPLLSHRPALQKDIDTGIAAARTSPSLDRRAFVLRTVIDRIRTDVNPNPKPVKPPEVAKSLWQRLGGSAGVRKVVDDLVKIAGADNKVDFFRGMPPPDADKIAAIKKQVVDFIHDATKSPDDKTKYYTGKDMKAAHKGMHITNAQFDAFAADLRKALDQNGVKKEDADKLVAIAATTRKDIVEGAKPPPPMVKSLWERLGGETAVKKVVDDLVKIVAEDKTVDFFRGKPVPKADDVTALKKQVVDFIHDATKSPDDKKKYYTGKDMKAAHKGMHITNAQFDAFAADFKKALEDNKVKADDITAVMNKLEGTRKDIVEGPKPKPEKEPTKDKPAKDKPTLPKDKSGLDR